LMAILTVAFALIDAPALEAKKGKINPWTIINGVDKKMFFIHKNGPAQFSTDVHFSGVDTFLSKNWPGKTAPFPPITVKWKKSDGRGVAYYSEYPANIKEASYYILKEYKDIFLPPSLAESLKGYTLDAFKKKNGYVLTALILK